MSRRASRYLVLVALAVLCRTTDWSEGVARRCHGEDLQITIIAHAGESGGDLPVQLGGEPVPSVMWNFATPSITSNGHILFTTYLSTSPTTDVFGDTRDSIWTTHAANPSARQMQVRWGSPAPADDWPVGDAPIPVFDGTRSAEDRMSAWGVSNEGAVLFTAGRF
ncbi:MAG: hypothetical protein AAF961_10430, partial [Planctomycetota bacterium]